MKLVPLEKDELIDPRPDETVDAARLGAYLADRLEGADQPLAVKQFSGGLANLTYLLKFGSSHEYVYRRPPLGTYAAGAHDMSREFRVLSVLNPAFNYAPRAYLYVEDADVMGAPFLIMERRAGTTVRRSLPDHYAEMPDAPRRLSEALVDALVEFHAVDYEAIGLSNLGRPQGFISRQVAGWKRRWDASKLQDNADVDRFYDWLVDNLPESTYATLVHNDYKLDNTMLADDNPSELVAVLDWDMCTLGDPLMDLGTLLTYWTEPQDPQRFKALTPMPTDCGGFLSRRQIVGRYFRKSGREASNIRFYHVLGLFRWLVFLQQMYFRYVQGQTQDRRYTDLHLAVDALAKSALEVALGKFPL